MSDDDGFLWNFIGGILIGFILLGAFRLAWHLLRIVWYLSALLLLSIGTGLVFLIRKARPRPDPNLEGFGQYSDDRTRWQAADGEMFAPDWNQMQHCEVLATEAGLGGMYWKRTAWLRLFRRGAAVHNRILSGRNGS